MENCKDCNSAIYYDHAIDSYKSCDRINYDCKAGKQRYKELKELIPADYINANFNSSYNTPQLQACKDFMKDDKRILFLSGITETGKTHSAVALFFEYMINNYRKKTGLFIDYWELKDTFFGKEEKNLGAILNADLLAIDDLCFDFQDSKNYIRDNLTRIFNTRFSNCKKTLVTLNHNLEVCKEMLDPRVFNRLLRGGDFFTITERIIAHD